MAGIGHVNASMRTDRGQVRDHNEDFVACYEPAGAGEIDMDYRARKMTVNGVTLKQGDWISLNGSIGALYAGQIETVDERLLPTALRPIPTGVKGPVSRPVT